MKNIHFFAITMLLGSVAVATAEPSDSTSSYFPLQIGDQWTYTSLFNTIIHEITDTARIRGHLYYGMSSNQSSLIWFRYSNDTVFAIKSISDSAETPLYNLNSNIGDTLTLLSGFGCTFGIKTILASKEDTVPASSGAYIHCYHFKHISGCVDAGMIDSWLARGIGIVQYNEEDFSGMFIYNLYSSTLTSARLTNADVSVSSYLLLNSYPNPFNPQTTLSYHINKSSHVTIGIFDLLGREIVQLVNEQKTLGNYQTLWNAEKMPSGVYFAVLRSNGLSITRKLILQK
jgi:hypothetical protein